MLHEPEDRVAERLVKGFVKRRRQAHQSQLALLADGYALISGRQGFIGGTGGARNPQRWVSASDAAERRRDAAIGFSLPHAPGLVDPVLDRPTIADHDQRP
jgi:hypothetical protein